jgi:hypothetical protein
MLIRHFLIVKTKLYFPQNIQYVDLEIPGNSPQQMEESLIIGNMRHGN